MNNLLYYSLPMLQRALQGGYAIPALNANGTTITNAILLAAKLENSPVIVQASQGAIAHTAGCKKGADDLDPERGIAAIVGFMNGLLLNLPVEAALNIDHGSDIEQVKMCNKHGFTMLMADFSKKPLDENIRLMREIVELADSRIAIEGEIGQIGALADTDEPGVAIEEMKKFWTRPEEAARLKAETGLQVLAMAIGQIHGCREKIAKIDFDLLKQIVDAVGEVMICMHGASGIPEDDIVRAINEFGIVKVNVDTMLRKAYMGAYMGYMESDPNCIDQRKPEMAGLNAVVEVARGLMRLFGSSGKAVVA